MWSKNSGERRLNNQDGRRFKTRLTTISERGDKPLFFSLSRVLCSGEGGGGFIVVLLGFRGRFSPLDRLPFGAVVGWVGGAGDVGF